MAGCQSQAPVCDPFFGRTTIPPPPTGSVTGRPADPCYQPPALAPSQAPAGTFPPVVQLPATDVAVAIAFRAGADYSALAHGDDK